MLRIVTCLVILVFTAESFGQDNLPLTRTDFSTVFGEKYHEAASYFVSQQWITDSLAAYGIPPNFAKAIVFPEVIRFSAISDKLEMQGLFTLYVQYGIKYSNFSVGRFQMKPSFAEQVEKEAKQLPGKCQAGLQMIDLSDTPEARFNRVKRLNSPEWQLKYLILFIEIMDQRYNMTYKSNDIEKLRFYATAYNCGFTNPEQVILQHIKKSYFHTAVFSSDKTYCYSDIASAYYTSTL
jgi:hypothetical protein